MASQSLHPEPQQLRRLLLGQLPDQEAEQLEEHLKGCPSCAETVRGMQFDATGIDVLLAKPVPAGSQDSPVLAELRERLQRLGGTLDGSAHDSATGSAVAGEWQREAAQEACGCLRPPQKPDELGRLGGYRVLKLLGAGGMGAVFLAEDEQMQRRVAAKPFARERFLREARAAAALSHDNIVTIHQVGEDGGVPFLAMQYLEGLSLDERLRHPQPLNVVQMVRLGWQIAQGLAAAHERGLVHRDIKPANIWIEPMHGGRVKILDFGLARSVQEDAQLTQSGEIVGTPSFMAPEQARGDKADARSDLFSLGCLMYRMCTGRLPFQGANTIAVLNALANDTPPPVRQLNPDIPEPLEELIRQLLLKNPAERPASAHDVSRRFQALERTLTEADQTVLTAPEVCPQPQPVQTRPRRWLPVAVLAALLLLTTAILTAIVWIYRIQTPQGELVIESEVPGLEITVKRNGEPVHKITLVRGKNVTKVSAGIVSLEIRGVDADTVKITNNGARLEKDGKLLVKIEQIRRPAPITKTSGEVQRFVGHQIAVKGVALTLDGKYALSGSSDRQGGSDKTLRLWDVASGKQIHDFGGHTIFENSIAVSPDGRHFLSGGDDGFLRLWEIKTGKLISHMTGHQGPISEVCFSPDGTRAAAASTDGCNARVWNLQTGEEICRFIGHGKNWVWCVAFSPDGKYVLSGGHDGFARIWDARTAKQKTAYNINQPVSAVALSRDGKRALIASGEGRGKSLVQLWDLQAGKELRRFSGHGWGKQGNNAIYSVAFSPDEKRIVSGGYDGTVRVWDVDTERQVAVFKHDDYVRRVAYAPDGRHVLSGGADGTLRLWAVPPDGRQPILPFRKDAAFEVQKKWLLSELERLNPGCDGQKTTWDTADGDLIFHAGSQSALRDLAPLAVLKSLTGVDISRTQVASLEPLHGLRLWQLNCGGTPVNNLKPVQDLPLTHLSIWKTAIKDLRPVKGMKLVYLDCHDTPKPQAASLRASTMPS